MARKKENEQLGCGCAAIAILVMLWFFEKYWEWTLIACLVFLVVYLVYSRRQKGKQVEVNIEPEFEIKYCKANGDRSVRKIKVVKIGEFLDAYCFLKNSVCTFAFYRIEECVDLSTGELVTEDFRNYYAKSRADKFRPCDVFDFYYWEDVRYSDYSELPKGVSKFEIDEKHLMEIATYKEGVLKKEFLCGHVIRNKGSIDRYLIELIDDKGEKIFAGMSKIISVDGIDDFGKYLTRKFYESKIK